MANLQDDHDHSIVFDSADEAVVFNAIAPKTSQVAAQGLAKAAGIIANGNAFS
jgi:hypothetical protein